MVQEVLERKPTLLERIKIIGEREADLVEAYVPVGMIFSEDVPTDAAHVRELADSMAREKTMRNRKMTGQNSPVSLAEIPNFGQFPIIDGFHRVGALDLNGENEVWCTIRLNSTWEDVVDQRILAAATHRSVRFARIVEWIEQAWDYSPWSGKLSAMQAFQLNYSKTMTGQKIGLDADEAQLVKDWVARKCEQWHISPTSVYDHLSVSQMAAPELVKETRERKSGKSLDAVTPQHLKAIATVLPYRHDIQILVAETAKRHTLTVPRTRGLALSVAKAKTIDEAKEIVDSGSWNTLGAIYSSSRKRELRREVEKMSEEVTASLIESLFEDELRIAELMIENAMLTGRYEPKNEDILPPQLAKKVSQFVEEGGLSPLPVENIELNGHRLVSQEELDNLAVEMFGIQDQVAALLHNKFEMSWDDAEDYFADIMLKALTELKRGKLRCVEDGKVNQDSFKSWCMRVAVNLVYSKYRKYGQAAESLDDAMERMGEEKVQKNAFRDMPEDDERVKTIKRVLPYLSDRYRRILILSTVFDLPSLDVGKVLSIEPVTARVDLHRAKKRVTELVIKGF